MIGESASDAIRSNARVVGVLLQCLAVVTLVGTLIVAITVAQKGQQYFDVPAAHDPVPWIVLASGVSASLIFAGLGYALAMLCAIYDRQEIAVPAQVVLNSVGPRTRPSTEWRTPREAAVRDATGPLPPKSDVAPAIATSAPNPARSGLWAALTKERHVRKSSD